MSQQSCHSVSSCASVSWLGELACRDVATLDRLAVKFIGLDSAFAMPLREMGRIIGVRMAMEQNEKPVCLDAALSARISVCGLAGVIESRFLRRNAEGALLQMSGCLGLGHASRELSIQRQPAPGEWEGVANGRD